MSSDEDNHHLELLLAAAREELGRADQKAAILIAAVGIAISPFITALLGDENPAGVLWLYAAAVVLMMLGIVLFGLAIFPQTRRLNDGAQMSAYFEDHVTRQKSEVLALVRTRVNDEVLADQIWEISSIVSRKYRVIRYAMVFSGLGVLTATLALVQGQF